MTDPNNETIESADSEQELNTSAEVGEQPLVLTGSHSVASDEPERKSDKPNPKAKKDVERKAVVSEKFSRSESRGFQLTSDGLLRHFLACRICCYFLTGVQVLYGRQVVDRLVHEFDGTWMYVPLTRETRTLLQKTYGVRVDDGDFFIEHACEVCCRRFVIDLPELGGAKKIEAGSFF